MKGLIKKISLLSRSLLLVLFISYSGSVMFFYHTHLVHGFLITHSHPFKLPAKKGAAENHSHTNSQYILLQHLSETPITDSLFACTFVPDVLYAFCSVIMSPHPDQFYLIITSTESLRGPPVCWISRKRTIRSISFTYLYTCNSCLTVLCGNTFNAGKFYKIIIYV